MAVQAGSVGIAIVYQVLQSDGVTPMNMALATVKNFVFTRPNLTVLEVPASLYTDGSDGLIKYVTTDEDELNPYGVFQAQAYVEIPGYKGKTEVALFTVERNAA